jgi:predicted ester cyclase
MSATESSRPQSDADGSDEARRNAATTRRHYDALWNRRDRTVIAQWIAPAYVGHLTRRAEPVRGVSGFESLADELFTAFPDLRMTIEDLVADGDRVVSRVRLTGTQVGPMEGYAPTGARVDTSFVAIERYLDGICVEEWVYSDDLGIARQIKALPAAGSFGERTAKAGHRLLAPLLRRRAR